MAYERYIKRGGNVYGPYLYESYRDKHGKKKTRYVSGPEEVGGGKKFSFNFPVIMIALVAILLVVGLLVMGSQAPEKIQAYKSYAVSKAKVAYYAVLPVVQRASSSVTGFVTKEPVSNETGE
ncbi:hypothetical protein GOV13_05600 [Candidatus Pacearchaeota archaeon]|nr:hypothetical protein [Candidatus Pacearchaeota archaeon]